MSVPEWLEDLWKRVTLWIRIPGKKRDPDHIKYIVRKSLTVQGFCVHHIHIDYNESQDKYYVRPVVSGTCKSTQACVDVLANTPAGEVRLETEVFVYQRDNLSRATRPFIKRHIKPDKERLYTMKIIPPERKHKRRRRTHACHRQTRTRYISVMC